MSSHELFRRKRIFFFPGSTAASSSAIILQSHCSIWGSPLCLGASLLWPGLLLGSFPRFLNSCLFPKVVLCASCSFSGENLITRVLAQHLARFSVAFGGWLHCFPAPPFLVLGNSPVSSSSLSGVSTRGTDLCFAYCSLR